MSASSKSGPTQDPHLRKYSAFAQLQDLAAHLVQLAGSLREPQRGSQLALDNEALGSMTMSAYVRNYVDFAAASAEAIQLLLTHPVTKLAGGRAPFGSLAPHQRAIIESTARVLWVTGGADAETRTSRLRQQLHYDLEGFVGDLPNDVKATLAKTSKWTGDRYKDGADKGRVKDTPPARETTIAATLDENALQVWKQTSAETHYSPTWDMLLTRPENGDIGASNFAGKSEVVNEVMKKLIREIKRIRKPI